MRQQMTLFLAVSLFGTASVAAQSWPHWRGPEQSGISRETGIVDSFNIETMENVRWISKIGGRSTPIVLNNKVYLNCRTSENTGDPSQLVNVQEQVICWDAMTGKELWSDRFNVFGTDIPVERVGWAHMVGDPETGYVYVHSVSGILRCYTGDGEKVWEISLFEELGKISGYGGRTQTPIIDEDRLIVSSLAVNWGDFKGPAPLHYYFAFDKKTGELRWMKAPGGKPRDTNYSVPVVSVVDGTRMLIGGNSDGGVYAMNARTGEKIWGYLMSKRGLNSTPAIADGKVFISHGEDNVDTTRFGRVQCLNAKTGESIWRVDDVKAGYTAILYKDGIAYVVADTGDMFAFDGDTGKELWKYNLGTVGKGSPIFVDGKIIVTEVDGKIHICKPSREGCEKLCEVQMKATSGKGFDEIYGSPAVANGLVYVASRDRLVCFGAKTANPSSPAIPVMAEETPATEKIAHIQLWPYETRVIEGESVDYRLAGFDENGRFVKMLEPSLEAAESLGATEGNQLTTVVSGKHVAGVITAKVGDLVAKARLRVFPKTKQWKWNFDGFKPMQVPPTWLRAFAKMKPTEVDGNMAMKMGPGPARPSHFVWFGPGTMSNYTIQSDVLLREQKRRLASVGICVNRYTFVLNGNEGVCSFVSWPSEWRLSGVENGAEEDFEADPDVWYTMKMKVELKDGKAFLYGKIWEKGGDEPTDWTLEVVDPKPNSMGSPGVYSYAIADCFFDNIVVTQE